MTEDKSIVGRRAKQFAIAVINAYKNSVLHGNDDILLRQFLKSSTSIGANIAEATGSYSRKDFCNKMSIAYKEARESLYWLELLYEAGYIADVNFRELNDNLIQINKMLFSILRSTHFGKNMDEK